MSGLLQDYDYAYPPESVAQEPLADRDASRMMVLSKSRRTLSHRTFMDLIDEMESGDLIVANDTSVIAARIFVRRPSESLTEVFLIRPVSELEWKVFLSPKRGLREGMKLPLFSRGKDRESDIFLTLSSLASEDFRVRFDSPEDLRRIFQDYGEPPLPPYIRRDGPRDRDRERYQTVFARNAGAVAAPTAGLHFTEEFRGRLQDKGVLWSSVTLHVGPGTFLPVKVEKVDDHVMHREWYQVPEETRKAVAECRSRGGNILAVGTTSLRALESWALTGETEGETGLFIRPGFEFKVATALLTNFHQPKSTLLMLVSAFAERTWILEAYREAIAKGFRLFSYGDCMLIRP